MKWEHLIESDKEIRELERRLREAPGDKALEARYKIAKERARDKRYFPLELNKSEQRGLSWLSGRYVSAEMLWSGWDDEENTIPVGYVAMAYIGTGGDGGNVRTVPGAGGSLDSKIQKLFNAVEEFPGGSELYELAEEFGQDDDVHYRGEDTMRKLVPRALRFFGDD